MPKISFPEQLIVRSPLLTYDVDLTKKNIVDIFFENRLIKTSIYLTSPSLYNQLEKYKDKREEINELDVFSLYKFMSRMSTRCTPYGIFAGINVSDWDRNSMAKIVTNGEFKPRIRMDMGSLSQIINNIDHSINDGITYYLNNTGYMLDGKFIYLSFEMTEGSRKHSIRGTQVDDYLKVIIEASEKGINSKQFISLLQNLDNELTEDEIRPYFQEVVNSHILISELEPNVTGEHYLERVLQLDLASDKSFDFEALRHLHQQLKSTTHSDKLSPQFLKDTYNFASEKFQHIIEDKNFYQVDTSKILTAQSERTEHQFQKELREAIQFLYNHKYEGSNPNSDIEQFKSKFFDRYEYKMVPLSEAVDPEIGLGFPVGPSQIESRILDGIPRLFDRSTNLEFKLGVLQQYMLQELKINPDAKVLDLSTISIEPQKSTKTYLHSMYMSMMSMVEGDQILLKNIGRTSGLDLLTRFADVDENLHEAIAELAEIENRLFEDAGYAVAEICHLPNDRLGNILIRPHVRPYEIPYLSLSTKHTDFQILIKDLYLYYDSASNNLRTYSKKLNKHIHVTHSNAFNYSLSKSPAFRLLCEMEGQNRAVLEFNDGGLKYLFKKLPRITYKNVIFRRASWSYSSTSMKALKEIKFSDFKSFQQKEGWPNKILIQDTDNELYFDFANDLAIKVFLKEISKKASVDLIEFLEPSSKYSVQNENGDIYTNEFVVPVVINHDEERTFKLPKTTSVKLLDNVRDQSYFHGDAWKYYRVYCGINFANELILILSNTFKNVRWFFIRYSDDLGFHIRFRFYEEDNTKSNVILAQIYEHLKPSFRSGHISKMVSDVYDREVDRYGENTIHLCEEIFHHDSILVCDIVRGISKYYTDQDIWKLSLLVLDEYYNNMGFDLDKKAENAERVRVSYGLEYSLSQKTVKIALNNKFRDLRPQLVFLEDPEKIPENLQTVLPLIKRFSKNTELAFKGIIEAKYFSVITSLLHMHYNRLFKADQRFSEFVLYYMAAKYYSSMVAKKKYMKFKK